MKKSTPVTLRKNGQYWTAAWRDEYGQEQRRGIGSREALTRKDALMVCEQIAAEVRPDCGKVPTLAQWKERHLSLRRHLADTTLSRYTLAHRRLAEFAGEDRKLDRFTPADANDFVAWLRELDAETGDNRKLSDFSVWSMASVARDIFAAAVDDGRIATNPFARVKIALPKKQAPERYVSEAEAERVIDACPDAGWRAMFALCRYAGLRASEAMALEFGHVDLERGTLTVWPRQERQTTKQATRTVPVSPRLARAIQEAQEQAQDGTTRVAFGVWESANYNHAARVIMAKAGLDWPKPFQACRASCETDWHKSVPAYLAAAWIGHDLRVSQKHYLQTRPEDLAIITGRVAPKNAQFPHNNSDATLAQR